MPAFGSPWLFADRCALLRLPVPRHSPCALLRLTFLCSNHLRFSQAYPCSHGYARDVLFFLFIQFSRFFGRNPLSFRVRSLPRLSCVLLPSFPRSLLLGRLSTASLHRGCFPSGSLSLDFASCRGASRWWAQWWTRVLFRLPAPASLSPSYRLCLGDISVPMVGSSGLEPPTSRLSGVRSNHLSYEPIFVAVCRCFSPLRPTFAASSASSRAPGRWWR